MSSQIFPELTGKIFVIFQKNPMFAALCIRFFSPPLFRNSIARGGSLFCKSAGMRKLRALAQNAILLARMRVRAHEGSGAKMAAARAERNRGEGVLRRALT